MSKIPPSLAWLARKRARTSGKINRLQQELAACQALIQAKTGELERAQADLAAIDRTMGLHEIQVNPELIPEIRPPCNPIRFQHGEFRGTILCLLRASTQPVGISQLVCALASSRNVELDLISRQALYNQTRYAIKNLHRQGLIRRVDGECVHDAAWIATPGITRWPRGYQHRSSSVR